MTTTTGNSKKINNAKGRLNSFTHQSLAHASILFTDLLTDEQRDVLRTKENKIEKLEAGKGLFQFQHNA